MDFFSGGPLTDEQLKSLWAFLGVALGAVVTLVGTLLTDQHNRRTAAIEREAEERQRIAGENQHALAREAEERQRLAGENQQALATQAERRITLDTVARTMELITDNGEYAKTARVGGAIATMVELEGGAVAMRILGELWIADAVDSDTAVWLIERVLRNNSKPDEVDAAADLLSVHVAKLVPAKTDQNQDRLGWPALLEESWPMQLPSDARNSLIIMAVKLLQAREPDFWKAHSKFPVLLLYDALEDEEHRKAASFVLTTLLDLKILRDMGCEADDSNVGQIRAWSASFKPLPWFRRLVSQFEGWAAGEEVRPMMQPPARVAMTPERATRASSVWPLTSPIDASH